MGTLRNALVVLSLLAVRAHADIDIKKADKLFEEGLALRETNLEQSCKKFRESLEWNPQAIGTLMNVALCDEKLGRIASAVVHFSEARDRAKEGNLPDYVAEAESRIAKLEPELPKVTIKFVGQRPEGTRVLLGDIVIPASKYESGQEVPVDPGELVIVVSAPGRLAYETKMMIGKKERKAIEVPELKKGVTVKSSRKTIGIITTAAGGTFLVTGVVLGIVARGIYNDNVTEAHCNDNAMGEKICDPAQQSESERARTYGNVGTVVGAVGLAAAGVGLYLWLSAPNEPTEQRRVTVVPSFTSESAGLTAVGRF